MELGVLGLRVLQLDRHLVARGDVRRDVDVSEAATSDLATEAISSRDPNVQFTCYTSLSICSLLQGYTVEFLGRWWGILIQWNTLSRWPYYRNVESNKNVNFVNYGKNLNIVDFNLLFSKKIISKSPAWLFFFISPLKGNWAIIGQSECKDLVDASIRSSHKDTSYQVLWSTFWGGKWWSELCWPKPLSRCQTHTDLNCKLKKVPIDGQRSTPWKDRSIGA